ncbi:hypothetical protein JCM16303_003482 [Sporobolomyces ruberrimus]
MDNDGLGRTRVAVIGSGLAGLTAAHLLSIVPSDVEVHVFEKSEELGMDNSSISIKGDKGSYRIDVPMRSINSGSHGRVKKLYNYLKVPLVRNEFSYSFSRIHSPKSRSDDQESTTPSTGSTSRASTPLPPYSEEPSSSLRRRASPSSTSNDYPRRASPPPPPFPRSTTTLLYEGSSGLRWPPVSIPSTLSSSSTASLPSLVRSTWNQSVYIVHLIFLAFSYLHILLLSFFYVKLNLTQSRTSLNLPFFGKVENVGKEPLEEWCKRHGVLEAMKEEILIPLMAAVCTVGVEEARSMPVGETLEYIASTFLSAHYTTAPSFGVRGIVRRLVAPVQVSNIYLSSHIQRIVYNSDPDESPYTLKYRIGQEEDDTVEGESLDVDYIVFATQANQAASLLETLSPTSTISTTRNVPPQLARTIEALKSFHYVSALVVNHTDQSFLPSNPSDRRDLNLAAYEKPYSTLSIEETNSDDDEEEEGVWSTHLPSTSVETTHIVSSHPSLLTIPHPSILPSPSLNILQTTNPVRPIEPTRILSSSWFSRAFVTSRSKEVLPEFLLGEGSVGRQGGLQGLLLGSTSDEEGRGGVYFTGSWCERGIPLLEGCVTSAENVVKEILKKEGVKVGKREWPF